MAPVLTTRCLTNWPKLAWVAQAAADGAVTVRHGPCVETGPGWLAEAVWAGDFATADFDRTDLVFGSGIRCRDNHIDFVSTGCVFDRLLSCRRDGLQFVSNSLPALLAVAGLDLRNDYLDYPADVASIVRGIDDHCPTLPTTQGIDVGLTYYYNLRLAGDRLERVAKPDTAGDFESYPQYHDFLRSTAEALGHNLADAARRHRVTPVATISSGYDSCAASVVARYAGCHDTITIAQSTSLWRGSDSGAPIARHLGMTCREHNRVSAHYPNEAAIWSIIGAPGLLNWTTFQLPQPLALLFLGTHGEKLWDRVSHDHPDPFARRDTGALEYTECRLHQGAFMTAVPFWGIRHAPQVQRITQTEEMKPYWMNKDYDKPIARRLVEDAGVPRELFGMVKRNTSTAAPFRWPYSADARAGFAAFLRQAGVPAPNPAVVPWLRRAFLFDHLLYINLLKRFGLQQSPGRRRQPRASRLIFQWANATLKQQYLQALSAGDQP